MRRAAVRCLLILSAGCGASGSAADGSRPWDSEGTKLVRSAGGLPAVDASGGKLFRPVDGRHCRELTTPRLVQPRTPLRVAPEVLQQRVQGEFLYGCRIHEGGQVSACRALDPVPFMDEAALEHVSSGRYDPARCDGKPVDVLYNFTIVLRFE
jgi:hypothetical protein